MSPSGATLTVTLASETDATTLTFLQPSGQVIWETQLAAGQTHVDIPLLYPDGGTRVPLSLGTYTVVAGDGSEELASHDVKLTQSMKLVEVGVRETTVQNDYDPARVTLPTDVTATIKNTGNLPFRITYFGLPTGVPSPSYSPQEGSNVFQFARKKQLQPGRQRLVLPPRTATFSTISAPLQYYEDPHDSAPKRWRGDTGHCRGTTHAAPLVIRGMNGFRKKVMVTIKYAGETISTQVIGADWGCTNITVTEQS